MEMVDGTIPITTTPLARLHYTQWVDCGETWQRQLIWNATVASVVTGECLQVNYTTRCTLSSQEYRHPASRQANHRLAIMRISPWIDAAAHGKAYLTAVDRVALIAARVSTLLGESGEVDDEVMEQAIREANDEYERAWNEVLRFGHDPTIPRDPDGCGWMIPIQPIQTPPLDDDEIAVGSE